MMEIGRQQVRRAIVASIEHWKNNAIGEFEGITASECPLCDLFDFYSRKDGTGCNGCPVERKVGIFGCNNTPWEDAYDAYQQGDDVGFTLAAEREVEFLKEVLADFDAEEKDDANTSIQP